PAAAPISHAVPGSSFSIPRVSSTERRLLPGSSRGYAYGRLLAFVNSDTTRLDDPQLAIVRSRFEHRHKLAHPRHDHRRRQPALALDHDDAGRCFRRETQGMAKIVIKRHEHAPFIPANLVNALVLRTHHPLIGNGQDIVTFGLQQRLAEQAQVLVALYLHS